MSLLPTSAMIAAVSELRGETITKRYFFTLAERRGVRPAQYGSGRRPAKWRPQDVERFQRRGHHAS